MSQLGWCDVEECEQHLLELGGAELVVVVLPLLYDFENYPFMAVHAALSDLGETHGIQLVDALTVLSQHKASDLWVHAIDHHPNEVAHALVADAILAHLEEQNLKRRVMRD